MDANQITTFCDTAAQLLTQLGGEYAAVEAAQHKDALMR